MTATGTSRSGTALSTPSSRIWSEPLAIVTLSEIEPSSPRYQQQLNCVRRGAEDDLGGKLGRWMRGEGDDVVGLQAKSEEYYARTLATILPDVEFVEGGYITRCVTSRTAHGE